jgi:7-cyano-7-deazaguanine synthase
MKKTVLIYSGGMDSTVLLYHLLDVGYDVLPLSIDYGQRHARELESAKTICHSLKLNHKIVDLTSLNSLLGGSSLTRSDIEVPEGHYASEIMKATIVPNRNMILLSVAAAWAISTKADSVSYAAHNGDHAIYPDCREEFATAINDAIQLSDWHKVYLNRPYVSLSKADIVNIGDMLSVPFKLTWSCYKGLDTHCGRCGTCVERKEAFEIADVKDPTKYL